MTSMLTLRPRNKFLLDVDMSKAGRLDYQDCNGQRGTEVEATRSTFAQEPALIEQGEDAMNTIGLFYCAGCARRGRFEWHPHEQFDLDPTRRLGITYYCKVCREENDAVYRAKHNKPRKYKHHARPKRRKR